MTVLRNRSDFNRALLQIKSALSGSKDIQERITEAFHRTLNSIRCESGAVWLYDRLGDGRIAPCVIHGSTDISDLNFRPGEGIIGETVRSGQPQIITDIADVQAHLKSLNIHDENASGLMVIPLRSEPDVIGCIHIVSGPEGAFGEDDIELLDMLSPLAAMEIEQSGMFISRKPVRQLIQLRNIVKTYGAGPSQVHALRGVNLCVNEGEFLVILGKSGCGKTTLLNVLGGIDGFDSGEYQFMTERLENASERALTQFRRDHVGFIFQQYSLMQDLTARENLLLVSGISKAPGDADKLLELVGLSERANRYPSQMSGGEQQRVAIARALMKSPQLILADEPTAALDEATGTAVLDVLCNMVRHTAITLVMITHNPEIAKMADRVAKIREGRLSEIVVNLHPVKASELTW